MLTKHLAHTLRTLTYSKVYLAQNLAHLYMYCAIAQGRVFDLRRIPYANLVQTGRPAT